MFDVIRRRGLMHMRMMADVKRRRTAFVRAVASSRGPDKLAG